MVNTIGSWVRSKHRVNLFIRSTKANEHLDVWQKSSVNQGLNGNGHNRGKKFYCVPLLENSNSEYVMWSRLTISPLLNAADGIGSKSFENFVVQEILSGWSVESAQRGGLRMLDFCLEEDCGPRVGLVALVLMWLATLSLRLEACGVGSSRISLGEAVFELKVVCSDSDW